jgi:hypothetical protein
MEWALQLPRQLRWEKQPKIVGLRVSKQALLASKLGRRESKQVQQGSPTDEPQYLWQESERP